MDVLFCQKNRSAPGTKKPMNCCHYINVFRSYKTKLLKKLGGLQKDETRQQWVKDLAEEQLQELYATDPNLEYTEQKERSLRKN